ncbi:LysR substrate-binding domain-containing protein [Actinophytocola glycyrrhizae]|uniref:LysR substrate-binding domain-containing protein n=1 Tax=Actinophytocola glycyrrhizae TaxID=2044873 RepID=A0ABV9S259_9PSEU
MNDLEIRELRYFRAVAEELNFSRAAQRLGIAQPPLSRAIGALERKLAVRLFTRDTRRVALTEAGETLLAEAVPILDAVTAAALRTRRANGPVVVTAKPGVASVLLKEVVADCPGPVEVLVSGYGEQAALVRTGRADAALMGSPHVWPDLEAEPLVTEPRVAALPAGHPLAAARSLVVADLAGHPMPRWSRELPAEREYWTGQSSPVSGPEVADSSQLLEVVALGQAVALVPTSLADSYRRADLVYRPVTDASPYTLSVVWAAGRRDRELAAFVRTAVEVAARRQAA